MPGGTSLVVQWLRFILPIQAAPVRSPNGELLRSSILHVAWCSQKTKIKKVPGNTEGTGMCGHAPGSVFNQQNPGNYGPNGLVLQLINYKKEKGIKRETYRLKHLIDIVKFKR